jgi:RNA recognition motif-containing protein
MTTRIHIGGLPSSCTNAELRQIFVPFGVVESAQILRDVSGHSLGLGVVRMSCPEEVEHVFGAQQLFVVEGRHLDIWEPADLDDTQGDSSPIEISTR